MKTLVLDATELRRDWLFTGLVAQLLGHAVSQTFLDVYLPRSAFEELVANHSRAVSETTKTLERVSSERRRLGLGTVKGNTGVGSEYREYLLERFDEVLGFDVMGWPAVEHSELVARAVSRTPPFDAKGGGYRDSLVWSSVLELAAQGRNVVLVSADKTFSDVGGGLAVELLREAELCKGKVELVRDLVPWLLQFLPWQATNLGEAVARAQDEAFLNYFVQSDIQDDLSPDAEDIGFDRAPHRFEVTEASWGGDVSRVSTREGADGVVLVEYDIDEIVSFEAELSEGSRLDDGWGVSGQSGSGRLQVAGEIDLVLRMGVLFGDEMDMSIEQLSWRRPDGRGAGPGVLGPDPTLTPLFDFGVA